MTQLHALSATEMVAGYRAGRLSPVEVTQAVLAHVARWEPHVQALYLPRPEQALAQARASESRWRAGQPLGPIDGVPLTLKENIATEGDPMPLGTRVLPLTPQPADAPAAARVRESGGVLLAKTTMPDFGMLSSGLSSFHPLTRNPWDLRMNPGGSSAGGGAAAAAGYGPLHVGTDIGGSLRLPASWCGVFSLKPSQGRVPIDPPYIGRVAGPMTRTVADSALFLQVLTRPDWRDSMSLPAQDIAWDQAEAGPERVRGLRIGLLMEAGCGMPVAPEVADAVQAAARLFEAAGAHVEPMKPFMTQVMLDGLDYFWRMRSLIDLKAMSSAQRESLLPFIRAWGESAEGMSGEAVFKAFNQSYVARVAAVKACHAYDYVLSPVAPVAAFPAEWAMPVNDPMRAMAHIGFTVPYNMSEQPAASINCGYTEAGHPVGLQIVGQRFDDLGVLQVASAFEKIRGPQKPWPQPPEA